ncbi:uncharacterized protein DSM5745_04469 [Aspergillus mulundensis]|uniref:Uncharacterized protein n=1 Tax=Aspergillus mulundensis TaxID=1810919 RepID=A0A3D8SCW6_9EURO|nr:hypothetical protein DSM5745_04469 [Aspergillus mulundensis]RDW84143.1 hypothetical protein DSM5745_04469 [Aspergillus mulundensis]
MRLDLRSERKSRRQKLTTIYNELTRSNPRLSEADLQALGIRHTTMSLEGDNGPKFFSAYHDILRKPAPALEEYVDWEGVIGMKPYYNADTLASYLIGYAFRCEMPNSASSPRGICYTDYGDLGYGCLAEITPVGTRWRVKTLWYMLKETAPHIVFVMYSEMSLDNKDGYETPLFYGEVKALIRVMYLRLKQPFLDMNVLAPVLCFSAIGHHHLRVIEAYHDGVDLVVRSTPVFNMLHRDDELLMALAKCLLGGASDKPTS